VPNLLVLGSWRSLDPCNWQVGGMNCQTPVWTTTCDKGIRPSTHLIHTEPVKVDELLQSQECKRTQELENNSQFLRGQLWQRRRALGFSVFLN